MDLEELLSSDLSAIQGRDFGPGCFSISSFFTFLQVIMVTIVNVNNNMLTVSNIFILFLKFSNSEKIFDNFLFQNSDDNSNNNNNDNNVSFI